jgi:hypothetical protein
MQYNIRDKWLAICIFRNPVKEGKNFNVTGNTKWKVCGSKSVAQRCLNEWLVEGDTLLVRMIQCKEIGTLIKDYGMWNGKDAQTIVKELTGVANEIVSMASELGVKI